MGLNFDHKIKARAHKGDMRIEKKERKVITKNELGVLE
jgi:hypothetical protein